MTMVTLMSTIMRAPGTIMAMRSMGIVTATVTAMVMVTITAMATPDTTICMV